MKEKTLEEVMNDYAIENHYASFESMIWSNSVEILRVHLKSIGERYANHVKAIALQEGFKKGCELQKGACAENAGIKILWAAQIMRTIPDLDPEINRIISSDSILNAPDAVSPFKTDTDEATGGK